MVVALGVGRGRAQNPGRAAEHGARLGVEHGQGAAVAGGKNGEECAGRIVGCMVKERGVHNLLLLQFVGETRQPMTRRSRCSACALQVSQCL